MPDFNISDINTANMQAVYITDVSSEISQGRRFQVGLTNSTSEPVIFKDLFNKATEIVETTGKDRDILFASRKFLVQLQTADNKATLASDARAKTYLGYRILTWISRLFSGTNGSYADELNKLIDDTDQKTLDLAKTFREDSDKEPIINWFTSVGRYDMATELAKHLCCNSQDPYIIAFINAGEVDRAISIIDSRFVEGRKWGVEAVIKAGKFDDAFFTYTMKICTTDYARSSMINRLIKAKQFDYALEMTKALTCTGEHLTLALLEFIQAGEADRVLEIAKTVQGDKNQLYISKALIKAGRDDLDLVLKAAWK